MSLLFRLLACLPLAWLHALGALLGRLVYRLSATYRSHLQQNLALAYPADAATDLDLIPAIAREAGKGVLELPKVWLRPLEEVAARVVQVSGWELVEAAWAEGEGIIFLTPHLGCFEITAQYYARQAALARPAAPITVLFRPPKLEWLGRIIAAGRARGEHLKLAPADLSGVRALIRALKRKEAVGLLPDQAPGAGEGKWLPFFGRPAYTMTLAARLSEAGGRGDLRLRRAPAPRPRLPPAPAGTKPGPDGRHDGPGGPDQPGTGNPDPPVPEPVPVGLQPLQAPPGRRTGAGGSGGLPVTRLALALLWLCHFLPLPLLRALGAAFGYLLYLLGAENGGGSPTPTWPCVFPNLAKGNAGGWPGAISSPSASPSWTGPCSGTPPRPGCNA